MKTNKTTNKIINTNTQNNKAQIYTFIMQPVKEIITTTFMKNKSHRKCLSNDVVKRHNYDVLNRLQGEIFMHRTKSNQKQNIDFEKKRKKILQKINQVLRKQKTKI